MEYFLKNFSELSIDTKGARFAHVLDALPLRCSIGIFSAYENDPLTPATYEEVLAFSGPYLVGLPTVTDTDGASRADGLSVEDLGNNEVTNEVQGGLMEQGIRALTEGARWSGM